MVIRHGRKDRRARWNNHEIGRLVMAVKNKAQVLIDGKVVTLSGYESEEYLHMVATYMNRKIAELSEMPVVRAYFSRQFLKSMAT